MSHETIHLFEICISLLIMLGELAIIAYLFDRRNLPLKRTPTPSPQSRVVCLNCDWDAGTSRSPLGAGIDHQRYTGHIVTFSRSDLTHVSVVG